MLREVPNKPWATIGVDFFYYKNENWILVVNYFSKYVEVKKLKNICGSTVINNLESIFARFGIPAKVHADNGPPFNSLEFKRFCKDWNFELLTSSPKNPPSNGMVERNIQTAKKMFKELDENGKDLYLALLSSEIHRLIIS